jgi:hypothetical protein
MGEDIDHRHDQRPPLQDQQLDGSPSITRPREHCQVSDATLPATTQHREAAIEELTGISP